MMKKLPIKDVWSSNPLEGDIYIASILPRGHHEFLKMLIKLNTLSIPKRGEDGFQAWGFSKGSSDYLKKKSNSFWIASNGNHSLSPERPPLKSHPFHFGKIDILPKGIT